MQPTAKGGSLPHSAIIADTDGEADAARFGHLLYVSAAAKVLCYDIRDPAAPTIVWENALSKASVASALFIGTGSDLTHVFMILKPSTSTLFISHNKKVASLDALTGIIRWVQSMPERNNYLLPLEMGLCVVGTKNLNLLDATSGEVINSASLRQGGTLSGVDQSMMMLDPFEPGTALITNCYGVHRFSLTEFTILETFRTKKTIGIPSVLPFNLECVLHFWDGFVGVLPKTAFHERGVYGRKTKIFPGRRKKSGVAALVIPTHVPDDPLLLVSSGSSLVAYHPLTHSRFWEHETFDTKCPVVKVEFGRHQNTLAYSQATGLVFVAGGKRVRAVRIKQLLPLDSVDPSTPDCEIVWETETQQPENFFITMLVDDARGLVFAGSWGVLHAIDMRTGEMRFVRQLPEMSDSHVCLAAMNPMSGVHSIDIAAQPFFQANWQ